MEKEFKQIIRNYLDNRAKTDELFAVAYAKPNKNIDECFNYILGEAKKQGNAVCLPDDVVFGWAVHYYDEDDIKINPLPNNVKAAAKASVELTKEDYPTGKLMKEDLPPIGKLTEEDYQKAYAQAMEEYKAQCLAEIKAKEEAKAKKEKEKRAALIAKRKEQEKFAPSLFDF